MIEYDYKLVRDEGDEIRTFLPDKIPTKLDNLIYIEGPNSCGKSTLLHILALGLHGEKNKEIPKSLRSKMSSLLDTEYQDLTFKIIIKGRDDLFSIVSEKTDPKKSLIKVYEVVNGQKKLIEPKRFQREYNLIYDIPIDPTARLNQLTWDIKDAQLRYGNRIGELRARMKGIVEEIRHSKDPNRINDLNKLLKENEKDRQIKKKAKELLDEEIDIIEKYTYQRYHNHYRNEYERVKSEIEQKEKSKKKEEKKKRGVSKNFITKRMQAKNGLREMQDLFNEVTGYLRTLIPKDEQHHLNIWERIDIYGALQTFEFNENFSIETIHFKGILNKLLNEKYKEDKLKEGEFYKFLIEFLKNFSDLDIKLPGGKSINEFKQDIEMLQRDFEPIIKTSENIETTIHLLDELKGLKESVERNILSELKTLTKTSLESGEEDYEEEFVEDDLSDLRDELQLYKDRFEFYEAEWIKKGRPSLTLINEERHIWEKYASYTEQQLKEQISQLKEDILNMDAKIENLDTAKERINIQISELEKKKEHPYREYLDELEDILVPSVESLEQKLKRDFDEYIKEIIDENATHSDDEDKERYYQAIFTYLAKKIGYIRHLSEEYKATYIDLIDEKIETDVGKIIRFADMGTGQSQSAYLMGKLNTTDDRKIIALFDEVAMMDSKSLYPIYRKFKELYTNGRLLAGVVIQRADKVNILSKI